MTNKISFYRNVAAQVRSGTATTVNCQWVGKDRLTQKSFP